MSEVFGEENLNRLMECLKERSVLEEAKFRGEIAQKKMLEAARGGEEEMEPLIQEYMAAHESEVRVVVRHIQNGLFLKKMSRDIKANNPSMASIFGGDLV